MSPTPLAVLTVGETEAEALALDDALSGVPGVRVVGAAWSPPALPKAIAAFQPQVVVAPARLTLPPLSLPVVRVPAGGDPVAALQAWQPGSAPVPPPGRPATTASAPPQPPPTPPASVPPTAPVIPALPAALQVRLGFWGARGGVGTTTAVLTAAQLLTDRGLRVALCDAAQRGDLHLYRQLEPRAEPTTLSNGSVIFMGLPAETELTGFAAVLVDGGRQRREYNVRWLRVEQPLRAEELRRYLPVETDGGKSAC